MKLTIDDIAKICGVSKGTVNRALHNKADINENTKERILKVVKELNYQPDYLARTLATGKSDTIGIIVPNIQVDIFFMLYTKIESICWKKGYLANLALSNNNPEKEEKYIQSFIHRKVDGLIIFPFNKGASMLNKAMEKDISTVVILKDMLDINANVVKIDDYGAISDTVQYLIDMGHERIAYIDEYRIFSTQHNYYIKDERLRAFRDTMTKNNIPYNLEFYLEIASRRYDNNDYLILKKLVDRKDRPTALVCFSDQIAIWVITGLKKLGLKVPQDISVTGFDDINELKYFEPSLTTNHMPTMEIAQEAMNILIEDIEQKKKSNRKVTLKTELIIRDSCSALK